MARRKVDRPHVPGEHLAFLNCRGPRRYEPLAVFKATEPQKAFRFDSASELRRGQNWLSAKVIGPSVIITIVGQHHARGDERPHEVLVEG